MTLRLSITCALVVATALADPFGAVCRAQAPREITEAQVMTEAKLIEAAGLALKGDDRAALEAYGALLLQDPTNSAAAYSAARLEQKADRPAEAVKLLQQAHRADPTNTYVTQALAEALSAADRHQLAAEVYGELFAADLRREEFLLRQSQSLAQAGKPDAGLKVLQAYLVKGGRLTPLIGQQRFTLAVAMNDADLAIRALEELMDAFPSNPDYYQELAQFYRRTGKEGAAVSIWERMAARFPTDERAALGLAGQGKLNKAEEDFITRLRPLFADRRIGIDNKILQLIPIVQEVVDRGDTVLANRVLPLALSLTEVHPDQAKAFAVYADLLLAADRPAEAAEAYAQTVTLDPGVYVVWEQYLRSLAETGATKRLLDVSEDALTLFPNQARLYLYNGRGLARLNDFTAAENTFRQGAVLAMSDRVLAYDFAEATAEMYGREARFAEALTAIDAALGVRPKHGPALARRAEILLRMGQPQPARESLKLAVASSPGHPYVLAVEALAALQAVEIPSAQSFLEAARRAGAHNIGLYQEVMGDAAFLTGDEAAAKTHWERAAAIGGGSHLLAKKLAEGKYLK